MNKRLLFVLICAVSLVLFFGLNSLAQETGKDALDLIVERGKLVVVTHAESYPWVFEDTKTGKITGFTIELARMYAKEIGVEFEIKVFDWAGVIPALTTAKGDMIAAVLSRVMPRTLKLLYCEPYAIEPEVAYALKGRFKDIMELNSKEVTITLTAGSIEEGWAKEKFPEVNIAPLAGTADVTSAVLAKRADAGISAWREVLKLVEMYPQLEVIPGYLMMDSLAFATRLDSFKLWQSVNLFMRLVKVDGRFAALYKQWLGVDWVPNALETSI